MRLVKRLNCSRTSSMLSPSWEKKNLRTKEWEGRESHPEKFSPQLDSVEISHNRRPATHGGMRAGEPRRRQTAPRSHHELPHSGAGFHATAYPQTYCLPLLDSRKRERLAPQLLHLPAGDRTATERSGLLPLDAPLGPKLVRNRCSMGGGDTAGFGDDDSSLSLTFDSGTLAASAF